MNGKALSLGFEMALTQNRAAMKNFESLEETEKQSILEQARQVHSKREMQQLISDIAEHSITAGIHRTS